MKKTELFFIAFFILLLSACAVQKGPTPIRVGFIADLTGNLANLGSEERIGTELARDEINAAGGINGRPLEIVFEDGRCSPKDATSAATKLVDADKVKVILGGTCTGESMAIAKVANENKIVELSAVTSGSVYSTTGEWTFRTNPADNAKDLVEYLIKKGYKKMALLSEQTDFSQSIRKDFKKWVQEKGAEVVADEIFDSEASDVRTQLTKMKSSNPDVYFLNTNSGVIGINIAKQAKEFGLSHLYGSRGYEAAKASDFPEILEGIIFYGTASVVDMSTPQAKKLFDEYEKRTGEKPFSPFAVASRYDGLKLMAKALAICGEEASCIKDWLYQMPPYEGVIGTFSFDQNGDSLGLKYSFSVFNGGKTLLLKT